MRPATAREKMLQHITVNMESTVPVRRVLAPMRKLRTGIGEAMGLVEEGELVDTSIPVPPQEGADIGTAGAKME